MSSEKKKKTIVGLDEEELAKVRPSLIGNETNANYRGFIILMSMLLIISHLRLILLNFKKYGVLWTPSEFVELFATPPPSLLLIAALHIPAFFMFGVEQLAALLIGRRNKHHTSSSSAAKKKKDDDANNDSDAKSEDEKEKEKKEQHIEFTTDPVSQRVSFVADALHIVTVVVFILAAEIAGIFVLQPSPVGAILVMLFTTCAFLKMWSFAHVCHNLRRLPSGMSQYPSKVTATALLRFLYLPTLCFQLSYPPLPHARRPLKVAKWLAQAVLCSTLIYIIAEQYIVPLVKNSIVPLETFNVFALTERMLKLAVPNIYIWLIGFYVIFHLILNILAELLNFGDRRFYNDWWNATTVQDFWSTWNLAVHVWMGRHLFSPLVNHFHVRRTPALFVCFVFSAIFHEMIVSIAFQDFKLWAFCGMMLQPPLILLSRPFRHTITGNVLVWLSLLMGQPLIVLLYFRDIYAAKYGQGITPPTIEGKGVGGLNVLME